MHEAADEAGRCDRRLDERRVSIGSGSRGEGRARAVSGVAERAVIIVLPFAIEAAAVEAIMICCAKRKIMCVGMMAHSASASRLHL
jgi:hypothetical protein